jgi:hypothetical protein
MDSPTLVLKFAEDEPLSLASSPNKSIGPNFKFERADWTLFRSVDTLSQKAGVPKHQLRRLVLKEIGDNALDNGTKVEVYEEPNGRYCIRDYGPGIDGDAADIAKLFSISRPLVSSKLLRMPQRGALGNGLRVVVGAVAASNGFLRVSTRNKRMVLTPLDDGSTTVETEIIDFPTGTLVEIELGPDIPSDPHALRWVRHAIDIASNGASYTGKTSPFWYDGDAFCELMWAAGDRPVREVIATLDGCSGAKAGTIAADYKNTLCKSLKREDAVDLLNRAREYSRPVNPDRLGTVGPTWNFPGYACKKGSIEVGGRLPKAIIPFVVEAWADPAEHGHGTLLINRTPSTSELRVYFGKMFQIFGAGLAHQMKVPKGDFDIEINVTAPYLPITSDGKSPDLSKFVDEILEAVQKAINGARRSVPSTERTSQKSVVLTNLDDAIDKMSGNRQFRFNLRQIFYVLRQVVQDELGSELLYSNFEGIITDYENEHGPIPLLYRDARGTLYHPHIGEDIPVGTMAVEEYERPEWTFNKILYIEKEGWFEALKAVDWPERNDCALLTSKGFSTRAVRDLLDLLGDHDEPITVFCVHDADGPGTMIYQTLQEETKARPRRRVEIVNLGLDPWEAIGMGLQVEPIKERNREIGVAEYVLNRDDGERWRGWLQDNRIELNAMSTPDFIAWLDSKLLDYDGKVVPPTDVIREKYAEQLKAEIRTQITNRILQEANIDTLVEDAMAGIVGPEIDPNLVNAWLDANPEELWTRWVDEVVSDQTGEPT